MSETASIVAVEEKLPTLYVQVPAAQRGGEAPPLYDDYRALFAQMTTVKLGEKRIRRVTDRIRNCAARMLYFLNYQLTRVPHPEEGLRYSRSQFQELFRYDYGLDIIELAQALLIESGLVVEPGQDNSTDRAFCWCISVSHLRQAFTCGASSSTEQSQTSLHSREKPKLTLVSSEGDAFTRSPTSSCESAPLFHDQKSSHGDSEITSSMRQFQDMDAQREGHGYDDSSEWKKEKLRELQGKRDHSSIPPQEKSVDRRGENRASSERKPDTHQALSAPVDAEEVVIAFQDAPTTPETVLTFFDRLRGYQLTGKLLQVAQEHAHELCFGQQETNRPAYPLQVILLTTVYLLKYDPVWQEHYERYCGRTGIPDVWAVNKWIGAKWPLTLRRLLETGAYVRLDDGTLLSRADYQASLEREQEQWQQKAQTEVDIVGPANVAGANERAWPNNRLIEGAEVEEQKAKPASQPSMTDGDLPDAQSKGFPSSYTATLHMGRLRRVLPPYFHVSVQGDAKNLFSIVITNTCAEDDATVLTCNKQVCEVLRVIQEERATEDQVRGWSLSTIAEWWCDQIQHKLAPGFVAEIRVLEEPRFGIVIEQKSSQPGGSVMITNNRQAEEILAYGIETILASRGNVAS